MILQSHSATYTFICQAGELELMSLLLAASLKNCVHHEYDIIAGIPGPESIMGRVKQETIDLLEQLGVRIVYIDNKLFSENKSNQQVQRHQLIANKIFLLQQIVTTKEYVIFLDTDQIFTGIFNPDNFWMKADVTAFLVWKSGMKEMQQYYKQIYSLLHVPLPKLEITFTIEGETFTAPPSANTGIVAVKSSLTSIIAHKWLEYYLAVQDLKITQKMEHINQLTFIAAIESLTIHANFIKGNSTIMHYISPKRLCSEPYFYTALTKAVALAQEHEYIQYLASQYPEWNFLTNGNH